MGNLHRYLGCHGNYSSFSAKIVEKRLSTDAEDFAAHHVNKSITNAIGIK